MQEFPHRTPICVFLSHSFQCHHCALIGRKSRVETGHGQRGFEETRLPHSATLPQVVKIRVESEAAAENPRYRWELREMRKWVLFSDVFGLNHSDLMTEYFKL